MALEDDRRLKLAALYDRYGNLVYRRARKLLRNDALARDVCHEVFLALMGRADSLYEVNVGWFYRVTTNHCLNLLRDAGKHSMLLQTLQSPVQPSGPPLGVLLRGVPPDLQTLALHYYVDEMTQEEIAELLGVSQRTVCSRIADLKIVLACLWADEPSHACQSRGKN
ncbi:MAG: sigma-70 family RNA polymerase sigma factor [Deltaproteobacteria bacterium]|nr:sigma-70 family RNA polymerase sigma factor [Deltaproteobacteria bacterium]